MDPTAASKYGVIESAVFISAERRGARPGTWADDEYTGIDFMTLMMTAVDQHEEANAQRDEAENPDYNDADSVPEVDEFDLTEFAVELEAVVKGASGSEEAEDSDGDDGATAHGGAPPGAPPDYRAREAAAMAEEESESESEQKQAPRKPRSRYVLDEADDTPEF